MTIHLSEMLNGSVHLAPDTSFLDAVHDRFNREQIEEGMNVLLPSLKARRLSSSPREWALLVETCLAHPLRALLHQDPFTYRAFSKPRGYAGDAVMMDFIYGREEGWQPPEGTSELGRKVFEYTTRSAACEGVRARRGFIADLLDRTSDEIRRPEILALASGHLREANLSSAVRRRKLGRLVALDADAESLKEVERCYGRFGVEALVAPIRRLLTNKLHLGQFDVVYSTGLFDYLQLNIAQRLTMIMFQMLRPGGRLLVANFLPGIPDLGYMESFMSWNLLYRTRLEMMELSASIPQAAIRDILIFAEENQHIIFLQVTKA